jgi:hypothetical protein
MLLLRPAADLSLPIPPAMLHSSFRGNAAYASPRAFSSAGVMPQPMLHRNNNHAGIYSARRIAVARTPGRSTA